METYLFGFLPGGQALRSRPSRDAWLSETVFAGAGAGALIGVVVGLTVGAGIGAAVGWYNEATLLGDDYEELFIGFGEYSMRGMAFGCAFLCAIYGGAAGAVSGAVAWASRQRIVGLGTGVALPLVLWLATDLFRDGRNQAGFVWCAGMLAGSAAAGFLCASRIGMSQGVADPGAASDRPRE